MKKIFIAGSSHFIDKNINLETPSSETADVEIYFGDEMNKSDFFAFVNAVSLFGGDKYAVIRNAFKIKEIEGFVSGLAKVSEASVIASSEFPGNKTEEKIIKAFKEAGFEIREENAAGKASAPDVIKVFREKGLDISGVNAGYVLGLSSGDMNSVENEAEKIALYLETNKNLTAGDVMSYISGKKEEKIYMAVANFAKKNTRECLEIYKSVPNTYENNMFVFFGIAKFLYNLYFYFIDPALPELRTQFQRNLMENKRYWSRAQTADTVGLMAVLDTEIKTGRKTFENAIIETILYPAVSK